MPSCSAISLQSIRCNLFWATDRFLPDVIDAVKNATAGGAAVTFEAVGNEQVLAQAYASTARGGKTICSGLPHPDKMLSIPAVSIVAELIACRNLGSMPNQLRHASFIDEMNASV